MRSQMPEVQIGRKAAGSVGLRVVPQFHVICKLVADERAQQAHTFRGSAPKTRNRLGVTTQFPFGSHVHSRGKRLELVGLFPVMSRLGIRWGLEEARELCMQAPADDMSRILLFFQQTG